MEKIIEVKDLVFEYEEGSKTIDHISFEIQKGTYTTILGHNVSGKSTIAKLLMGLLARQSGDIIVGGIPLTEEHLFEVRDQIGIVFQNPDNQFIGSTVRDDIAFGLENHCVEQKDMDPIINEYAAKVNMTDFLDSEPTHLSGGQKQRVAIAGVLAMHPDIIIFDESTSMLDPQGKDEIKKFIYHLHENKELTIISITHDIEEVSSSDHVIVLNDGKVVMDGKPDDVLYRTDELVKIQLDVPFALKLQSALAKKGINVGKCLDLESLVDEIWQLSLKK